MEFMSGLVNIYKDYRLFLKKKKITELVGRRRRSQWEKKTLIYSFKV